MKTTMVAAAFFASAALLSGCGQKGAVEGKDISRSSSAKDIGSAYINEMTRVAEALESVKDEASAREAAAKIRLAADGLNAMGDELSGDMSPIKAMQIFGGRYEELVSVQSRVMISLMTIQSEHPELMDIVNAEMDRLND